MKRHTLRRPALRRGETVLAVMIAVLSIMPTRTGALSIEKLFRFEPPPAGFYGEYSGDARLVFGSLQDETFAPSPSWIGYIEMKTPRAERIEASIVHFLAETALSAHSKRGTTYRLDVTIRRYRLFEWPVVHRDTRLRGEVFLEFTISEDGKAVATVLACGNAEHAFTARSDKKRFERFGTVHGAAVDDSLVKLTHSESFDSLFGAEWHPGPAKRPIDPKVTIGRIDRKVGYGPSPPAHELASRLRSVLPTPVPSRLSIDDFAYRDEDYLEELEEDPDDIDEDEKEKAALAERWLPEVLQEVLAAYYPGTSLEVSREGGEGADYLVLTGEVYRFDPRGSKQTLQADVSLFVSGSPTPLHTLHVYWISGSANAVWSPLVSIIESGVDARRLSEAARGDSESETFWIGQAYGGLSVMADEWAHNLAWALVDALESPADRPQIPIEVVFEGIAVPTTGGTE